MTNNSEYQIIKKMNPLAEKSKCATKCAGCKDCPLNCDPCKCTDCEKKGRFTVFSWVGQFYALRDQLLFISFSNQSASQ